MMRRVTALLVMTAAVGCSRETGASVQVSLLADDKGCLVFGQTVPCYDVGAQLRDTLRVPVEQELWVQVQGLDPTGSRAQAMAEVLRNAGYGRVRTVGFVSEPDAGAR